MICRNKRYAYIWADGVHFNVRLEEDRTCILVLIGATPEGHKELIAVQDGCGSRLATMTMVFKLVESASKRWRRLNGHELIQDVITGVTFTDGVKQHAA